MRDSNISTLKRIEALEARLAAQERALDSQAQRARMWAWPRDMWIGRTYAESESSYPTTGDTFRVQLLSAHFTGSEGTQVVTEHERGTIVTARTWPEAYLPYGTDVIVKRIRGIGPNGSGEWWIEPSLGGYNRCVMAGNYGSQFSVYGGTPISDPNYYIPWSGGSGTDGIWVYPSMVGVTGNSNGTVFEVDTPASYTDPWVTCNAMCWYRVTVHTSWLLHPMSAGDWQNFLEQPRHRHAFTDDPGAVNKVTELDGDSSYGPRRLIGRSAVVTTEIVPSFGARQFAGRSSLEEFAGSEGTDAKHASHSGVYMFAFRYPPGPYSVRIRVGRDHENWATVKAQVICVSATIEQASDLMPAS